MSEVLVTVLREEIGSMESNFINVLIRRMYFPLGFVFWNSGQGLMKRRNLLDNSLSCIGRYLNWLDSCVTVFNLDN